MAGEPISTNPKSLSHLRVVIDRLRRLAEGTATTVAALPDVAVVSMTAGGGVTAFAPVYAPTNGVATHANASALATSRVIGLAKTTVLTGVAVDIQVSGVVAGLAGLVVDSVYYLDTTAGLLTATAPTTIGQTVVVVGIAISATELSLLITAPVLL